MIDHLLRGQGAEGETHEKEEQSHGRQVALRAKFKELEEQVSSRRQSQLCQIPLMGVRCGLRIDPWI